MKKNFIKLLICPDTGKPPEYIEEKNILFCKKSKKAYKIINNIPVIIDEKIISNLKKDTLHQNYQTDFKYHDHYQKDAELYDYFSEDLDKATVHENRRLHETIMSKIPKHTEMILDVGCGGGWVAKAALKKEIGVISMDISTKNPQKVLEKYPHEKHFGLVADVFNLPIKTNSLNCIIASEIMEHVSDPQKFVEILFDKLKPGGKLIITTPYNEKIQYSLCVHCNRPTPQSAHLHSFNENNIKKLIPENSKWKYSKFSNKYLAKLQTHIFLSFLPYKLWKQIDKISNLLTGKQNRLLIEMSKEEPN